MNYFALAGGILAALVALMGLSAILRVAVGQAAWSSSYAFWAQAFYVTAGGTLAIWLFSVAL